MESKLTVAVLAGTTRAQRESIKAAQYVAAEARKLENVEVIFVDPVEFNFPGDGDDPAGKDSRYTDITTRADAFIIVTPEYNHSFPGSLKRMLDSEYDNYLHKPVALVGASSGTWGGVRACEALVPVCHKVGLVNIQSELYFPSVQAKFEADGSLKSDFREQYERNLKKLFDELLLFARTLKTMREEQV